MHSCDRPSCLERSHLSWGSSSYNSVDAFLKGRRHGNFRPSRGEKNGRSKLTDNQREEIVRRSVAGESPSELVKYYPVSISQIQRIRRQYGVAWQAGNRSKGQ